MHVTRIAVCAHVLFQLDVAPVWGDTFVATVRGIASTEDRLTSFYMRNILLYCTCAALSLRAGTACSALATYLCPRSLRKTRARICASPYS